MGRRGMDWQDVRVFGAVAAEGTARRAGRVLGLHHTTVSRRVDELESGLGVKLFERRPEGYVLTAAGEDLAATAAGVEAELVGVERRLAGRDEALEGTVTVTMAERLAVAVFVPRLPELVERHPGLEIVLPTGIERLDIARREADVAIRMDDDPPPALVGKRLFRYRQAVYATPAYLARHDLAADPGAARLLGWERDEGRHPGWARDAGHADVPVWGAFPDPDVHQAAVRSGLGIGMLPCLLADRDPALVRVDDREPVPSREVWVLTHADLRRTAKVRAVMTFAEQVLRDAEDEILGRAPGRAAR